MQKLFLSCLIIVICNLSLHAQSYIGHSIDNYSGVHGIILNPSSVVDGRMRTDINISSVSVFGGSDYFAIDLDNLPEDGDSFSFEDDLDKYPKEDNQFFLNVDALGPSVMFNLSPKHSIGITTRARTFLNFNNLNGRLYEDLSDGFSSSDSYDFQMKNYTGTIHAWGEFGVTYGRILLDKEIHFIKAGITLKYLLGGGSAFSSTPQLTGNFNGSSEILTSQGFLYYGNSLGFDPEDINFENTSSGFGGDLGFTYEYRIDTNLDTLSIKDNKYKLKLGLSVTDIGSISYDDSSLTTYRLTNSVNTQNFEDKSIEEILEENYDGEEQILSSRINLPTAIHFLADYNIRKHLYLSLNGSFSLIGNDWEQSNRVINTVTLTPRFETKIFSFYLPLGVRQYDDFSAGAGFRFGPLTVGSASALSLLLSDSSKTADVFLGLKVPIYQ